MNTTTAITDSLGVEFRIGDTVRVAGWGGNVRITDVGRLATVTRITPRGLLVIDTHNAWGDPIARGQSVRPSYFLVQRRDGAPGHEGNR